MMAVLRRGATEAQFKALYAKFNAWCASKGIRDLRDFPWPPIQSVTESLDNIPDVLGSAARTSASRKPMSPDVGGYMALTEAAYWIATQGGRRDFFLNDEKTWGAAFAELFRRIASDELEIIGRYRGLHLKEKIEGLLFSNIAVCFPFWGVSPAAEFNIMNGDKPYLYTTLPVGESDGRSDRLYDTGNTSVAAISELEARCADVSRFWKFDSIAEQSLPRHRNPNASKVTVWYRERAKAAQVDGRNLSEETDVAAAKAKWPNITRELVRQTRRKSITGLKRGRPSTGRNTPK